MDDSSPAARALLALELIQNVPGITGERLGERLGVSDRAARRYVGVLREAGIPIQSVPGRHGGYRVGRGFRLPPLMFSATEALGLVMATLAGRQRGADAGDPLESALSKIIRVLPTSLAEPAEALRQVGTPSPNAGATSPSPETTAVLVQSCAARHRLRLGYDVGRGRVSTMDVDPWAVTLRHGRWYLLCWSHSRDARRVLRVDRVVGVESLAEEFVPPDDLDPVRAVEEHLGEGWSHEVEVVVDAPIASVTTWLRRNLGRLEAVDQHHTRLLGSTDDPLWYAQRLAMIQAPFHVVRPQELRDGVAMLGRNFLRAGELPPRAAGTTD